MADRNLTEEEWKQFWKLPLEERFKWCETFSAHDAYRLRMTDPGMPAKPVYIPCNDCIHRLTGKPACKAFPNGQSADHIRAVIGDPSIDCGNGYHFEKGSER